MPKSWPVQDAKARFSEFLEASLAEGRQSRRQRPRCAVEAWITTVADQRFVSAVTIGEMQSGVEMTCEQDEAKAAATRRSAMQRKGNGLLHKPKLWMSA